MSKDSRITKASSIRMSERGRWLNMMSSTKKARTISPTLRISLMKETSISTCRSQKSWLGIQATVATTTAARSLLTSIKSHWAAADSSSIGCQASTQVLTIFDVNYDWLSRWCGWIMLDHKQKCPPAHWYHSERKPPSAFDSSARHSMLKS